MPLINIRGTNTAMVCKGQAEHQCNHFRRAHGTKTFQGISPVHDTAKYSPLQ